MKRATGPNSGAGHTSAIIALENGINYSLRVIKSILDGEASVVNVKPAAESQWSEVIQAGSEATVFYSGCTSWFVKTDENGNRWNSTVYHFSQGKFWRRSLFPVWKDFEFSVRAPGPQPLPSDMLLSIQDPDAVCKRKTQWSLVNIAAFVGTLGFVLALLYERRYGQSWGGHVWHLLLESPGWQSAKNLIPAGLLY